MILELAAFAPQLIKWVTGNEKAEKVTQAAVDLAQSITGTKTPDAALAQLRANPDLVIAYQQAIAGMQADLEKAYLADVDSARNREIAVSTSDAAPILNKVIVPVLALLVVIGGGLILYFSPEGDVRTAASNLIMLVLGYYFGTSAGSRKNQDALQSIATKNQG